MTVLNFDQNAESMPFVIDEEDSSGLLAALSHFKGGKGYQETFTLIAKKYLSLPDSNAKDRFFLLTLDLFLFYLKII